MTQALQIESFGVAKLDRIISTKQNNHHYRYVNLDWGRY
jgi:hypothetical protein